MLGLPTARVNRPDGKLKPVASETDNLHAYLAQIPGSKSWLDHILYLPGRTMSLNDGRHILAFAPTHRHHPTRQWIEGSDLVAYDGSTREVFVDENGFVFYAGTYQCHRLNNVYPGGTIPPSTISVKEITDAIFGAIRPSGWSGILHRQFPSGPIRVEATGLNLVGFNGPLYNTLRTQFTELKNARLRTMGSGSMETHRFSKFARLIILDRGLGAIPQDNRDA
ncbi:hypothetical protein FB45DRAFT_340543 [Roridomyces roridus]|uniref:Uncharacterized protein n=1 Tax=Roridomyces roridus TaxID=1738132 RepID=A0AAD7B4R7_9AGAR|nr:hypothetical protein FB45DRAFT_340543 [Roridomyces roridus]